MSPYFTDDSSFVEPSPKKKRSKYDNRPTPANKPTPMTSSVLPNMDGLPDLSNIYDKEKRTYSCPICVYKIVRYKQVNVLLTHVAKQHQHLASDVFQQLITSLYQLNAHNLAQIQYETSPGNMTSSTHCSRDPNRTNMSGELREEIIPRKKGSKVMRAHNNNKEYKCGKLSKTKADVQKHRASHNATRPYTCHVCNKAFTRSGSLKRHMMIHDGERPYTCNVCNKSFRESGTLKKHLRMHSGERPYSCDVCNKSFTRSDDLKTHMRIHSGDKPFVCDVCGAAFVQSTSLKYHINRHHTYNSLVQ